MFITIPHSLYALFAIAVGAWLLITGTRNFLSSGNPFRRSRDAPAISGGAVSDVVHRLADGWTRLASLPMWLCACFWAPRSCVRCDRSYRLDWPQEPGKRCFCPKCRERLVFRQWGLPSGTRGGYFARAYNGWRGYDRFLVKIIDASGSSFSHWYWDLSQADIREVNREWVSHLVAEAREPQAVGPREFMFAPTSISSEFRTLCVPDGCPLGLAEKAYSALRALRTGSRASETYWVGDLDEAIERIRSYWNPSVTSTKSTHSKSTHSKSTHSKSTHSKSTHSKSTHSKSSRRSPSPRLWTRQNFRADLLGVDWSGEATRVSLRRSDGRRLSILFSLLAADDQEYVRRYCPPTGPRGGWVPFNPSGSQSGSSQSGSSQSGSSGSQAAGKMTPAVACKILGLKLGSGEQEVLLRYRQLVKENHPDKNPDDPDAEKRMKAINHAFEVLSRLSNNST
jgi:hypothetical protein